MSKDKVKIAIVGGGIAGSSAALYFGSLGLDVTLFEKENSLISGPPFCHLHAGGNLYREISDAQCVTLLKQSIEFLRFYPFIVDYRPTVIVLPLSDASTPEALLPRLNLLTQEYDALIKEDSQNEVLGKSKDYFKSFSREEVEHFATKTEVKHPTTVEEWMVPVAKRIDLDKVQFPLIMVQEYGLNLFRLAAGTSLTLESLQNVTLEMQSIVYNIQKVGNDEGWELSYIKEEQGKKNHFDYLINAAGFKTGKIDDMVGAKCKAMVEFKAAYIAHCERFDEMAFPEIIFHGERGTPQGMGQFTPYPHGYFQLHGMTKEITLYDDGLVANTALSCQAKLGQNFIEKIEKSWTKEETQERTNAAVKHLSQYIPEFRHAHVGSKPLFGAQQIPGDDPTLRVAEVSFPLPRYARCEIVKVSSVLDMIDAISKQLVALGYLEKKHLNQKVANTLKKPKETEIHTRAEYIAVSRDYPVSLASRTSLRLFS